MPRRERGVAVAGLREFRVIRHDGSSGALVVNYAHPYGHKYRSALTLLASALEEVLGRERS